MNRRSFLRSVSAALIVPCSPAIVRASSLMAIHPLPQWRALGVAPIKIEELDWPTRALVLQYRITYEVVFGSEDDAKLRAKLAAQSLPAPLQG